MGCKLVNARALGLCTTRTLKRYLARPLRYVIRIPYFVADLLLLVQDLRVFEQTLVEQSVAFILLPIPLVHLFRKRVLAHEFVARSQDFGLLVAAISEGLDWGVDQVDAGWLEVGQVVDMLGVVVD